MADNLCSSDYGMLAAKQIWWGGCLCKLTNQNLLHQWFRSAKRIQEKEEKKISVAHPDLQKHPD